MLDDGDDTIQLDHDRSNEQQAHSATHVAGTQASMWEAFGASQHACLVVIPTYNEAHTIQRLVAEVLSQGTQFDVLIVDDNSPDGTAELVDAIAARSPRVQLLRRIGKFGLGTAYMAGFAQGLRQEYSYLCGMDADFSHQPRYLGQLLALAEASPALPSQPAYGADVVIGSRNIAGSSVQNTSWVRAMIRKSGNWYARSMLGLPIHDCASSFRCFRAAALLELSIDCVPSNGSAFQLMLNYRFHRAGYSMHEVPVVLPAREAGLPKPLRNNAFEAALMVWRLRWGTAAPASKRRGVVCS